jgi:hypothetical protein
VNSSGGDAPDTLDEPDVLDAGDAGDVVEGVGVDDLATGSSSASGWLVVSGGVLVRVPHLSEIPNYLIP